MSVVLVFKLPGHVLVPSAVFDRGLSMLMFAAMSAILRDRINGLLTANADLEREVARLRYSEAGK